MVALCLSIVLDAIQRFAEPQEVSKPKLVLTVGVVGLAFNILGLFVFHQHDHGHEHGQEGHSNGAKDELNDAEQGQGRPASPSKVNIIAPQEELCHKNANSSLDDSRGSSDSRAEGAPLTGTSSSITSRRSNRRSRSRSQADDIPIHPVHLRKDFSNRAPHMSENAGEESDSDVAEANGTEEPTEVSPLLGRKSYKSINSKQSSKQKSHITSKQDKPVTNGSPINHGKHRHAQTHRKAKRGHSHDDMNIKGIFFHVLGDALGNVGVMVSALIIWLTPWSFRFYFDPAISLLITLIILKSALPLCKDTAKPLLQAVPGHISVEDIQEDIKALPGIRSCHHVHVWALTPSKLIATLDVELDFDFEGKNAARYMALAKEIKSCLHGHGIHSSTIQPEFRVELVHTQNLDGSGIGNDYCPNSASSDDTAVGTANSAQNSGTTLLDRRYVTEGCGDGACLLDCNDACATGKQCCGPGSQEVSGTSTLRNGGESNKQQQH